MKILIFFNIKHIKTGEISLAFRFIIKIDFTELQKCYYFSKNNEYQLKHNF